jgi:hypothetical protein
METIEPPDRPATIRFYMNGPAFEKDIPLHLMLATLHDFQSILDKTYLGMMGRKRMSRDDRLKFQLKSPGIKHGSAESPFDIIMAGTQAFMPFYSAVGPSGVWDYTKTTFDWLKAVFEKFKAGQQPTYSAKENSVVFVDNSQHTTTYNGPVFQIGEQALPYYQNMTARIKDEGVDEIIFGKANSEIKLASHEKELFNLASVIDENPAKFKCEIFDFNKFDEIGKLSVFQGQEIPAGEYRFNVVGDQDFVKYVQAMLRTEVTVTCLKEMVPDPFGPDMKKISALQVLDVKFVKGN